MVSGKSMMGLATAVLLIFAAQAHAGSATCSRSTKGEKKHTAYDGSNCLASSDGSGKAKAKATGGASAQTFVETGGKSNSVASDQAMSEAESESKGKSTAHASGPGSDAFVDADQKGIATATATGGSNANVTALGKCNATGMATGGSLSMPIAKQTAVLCTRPRPAAARRMVTTRLRRPASRTAGPPRSVAAEATAHDRNREIRRSTKPDAPRRFRGLRA